MTSPTISRAAAFCCGLFAVALSAPASAAAPSDLLAHQVPLALDGPGTAWILTSTAFVLMMTLPGLALFYGGMVRKKNLIATIAHSTAAMAIVTVLWFVAGYTLSFGTSDGPANGFIGSVQALFLNGVGVKTAHALTPGLPEFLWISYQLTFAIITPALIAGAFAERIKFSASVLFFTLWHLIVYAPICHQVWGGGWMGELGVLDFARQRGRGRSGLRHRAGPPSRLGPRQHGPAQSGLHSHRHRPAVRRLDGLQRRFGRRRQ